LATALTGLVDLSKVRLVFRGPSAGSISNLLVGTTERGEQILNAGTGNGFNTVTVPQGTLLTGAYQLEMRQASRAIELADGAFPRFTDAITLVAPAGNVLVAGDNFRLRDAGSEIVFEFTQNAASVTPGNIAVVFSPTDTAPQVAQKIRDSINNPGVQSRLKVSAASRGGSTSGPTGDAQINLFGQASGDFGKVGVFVHSGYGDKNTLRDQGQVLIRDNFIRHSRDYGVWTEPGERFQDPRETLTNLTNIFGFSTAMSNLPNLAGGTGAVRNLVEPNNTLLGGFHPGIIIANNILESGGLGGVHVAGENPVWMITPTGLPPERAGDTNTGDAGTGGSTNPIDHFGSRIGDGSAFFIDSGRTRVRFEFEDMSQPAAGGGNGYSDNAVPIYYRQDGGALYLRNPPTPTGYSALEVIQSMRDSIFGSVLVTNGTTQRVRATVAPSLLAPDAGAVVTESTGYINYFNRPALYLEGVSNINLGGAFDVRRVDIAHDAQPFARVVNNTVYGNDGRASFNSESANQEPNDTIAQAIETWQGTGHNPISYAGNSSINAFDVDIYQFRADVGERAKITLNTSTSSLNPVVRIFDATGRPQQFSSNNTVTDLGGRNVDFTATKAGVYYAAVSSLGNSNYDPLSLAGREAGLTTGAYSIDLMVLHPQQFTITAQDGSQYANGETFRIFQVSDLPNGSNFRTFEFTTTGAITAGNVPIQFNAEYRASDMARAIALAITGVGATPLPNAQTLPNGNFAPASPLAPVSARALGGIGGVEAGLQLFPRRNDGVFPTHSSLGIGHDRTASGALSPTSLGDGTTERFVVVSNAAYIDSNSGVILVDPDITDNRNLDQILPETGILVTAGASPTLLNNVSVNVQTPIVNEETNLPLPFGNGNSHPKPNQVIVGGSVYQHFETQAARNRLGFGIENGPANLPNTGLDFNITLANNHQTFVNAQASQFLPAKGSRIIDSAIDTLEEREAFRTIREAAGLAISPVVAPTRDAFGQLRVDDPTIAPPNGQGANVFKDRGALERADFNGPTAVSLAPLDNDALNVDRDKAVSIIELTDGVYPEFRIQLVDGIGTGIDDATVTGSTTTLRLPGSAVTVFENGRLLSEGFDYRFSFDSTTNEVVLTPLAGIWKNDRVYEISINNQDRFVLYAPAGDQVSDADSFTITDKDGGIVYFEFDSGYRLQVPQGLSLIIPLAGGASGGIADGDRFSLAINGVTTTFEFDRNGNFLAGNRPINFQLGASQSEMRSLIFQALSAAGLAIAPRLVGTDRIFIGAERGVELNTVFSALTQPTTTLSLKMPALGPRPGGVTEGQRFQVSDGRRVVTFEYDTDGLVTTGNFAIDFSRATTVAELTQATLNALNLSPLNINPVRINDSLIHIGLSANGSATLLNTNVSLVGVSRALAEGEKFTITTASGSKTFELTRTGNVSSPTNIPILFSANDTQDDIGTKIANAIRNAGLGLTPVHVADGNIAVGGQPTDQINVAGAPSLGLFGQPGVRSNIRLQVFGSLFMRVPTQGASAIIERSTFSLTSNNRTVVFEMDSNGFTTLGNVPVRYTTQSTAADIAAAIAVAINQQAFGIAATATATGEVRLGQIQTNQLNVGNTGFTADRGVVNDAEIFTINNGTTTVTFEFDNVDLNNGFNTTNTPILFSNSSSQDLVVNTMKAVIEGAGLGLTTSVLPGGILELNATPTYTVNTSRSPSLIQTGVPGGAKAVDFLQDPSFSGAQMMTAIIRAINNAASTSLIALPRGGNTLFVENAQFISTNMDSFFLRGVADVAGNLLQPNRINNDTAFTILMPGTQLDFGDAPDPFQNTLGRYPSLRTSDGARHVNTGRALLGLGATAEQDGQSSPDAAADTDDGVQFGTNYLIPRLFNRFIQTPVTVTLTSPGFVDGWVDWNADGDWDDPNEQIFVSAEFKADQLTKTFMVSIPLTAPVPATVTSTFARFRSSSVGGLTPRGLATDGEVEDYEVKIAPGTPPQAVNDVYSVNEDGRLQTSDATGQSSPNFPIDDGVAANDLDPDSSALGVVLVQGPANAAFFQMPSNGTFIYVPNPNFFGVDTFTYRVNDGILNSNNIGTVTINVQEVNDAPVPVNDSFVGNEDQPLAINQSVLLTNDSAGVNESHQTIQVTRVQSVTPNGGSVSLVNGVITFTPAPDFRGFDTFTYTITDNGMTGGVAAPLSGTATVTVNVQEVNDSPIVPPVNFTVDEDTVLTIDGDDLVINALPGPVDEQAWQAIRLARVDSQSQTGGTVSWNTATNQITYTPKLNFAGVDTFVFDVVDFSTDPGRTLIPKTTSSTVSITVDNTNDAPFVLNAFGTVTLTEDQSARVIELSQVFSDPDILTANDVLSFEVLSNTPGGLVVPSISNGQLILQLAANQNGTATLVVSATDLDGLTVQDTLTVIVTPVNDPPVVASPLPDVTVDKNATIPSRTLSPVHFRDPDIGNGDVLTFRIVSNSNPLLVTPTINGGSLSLSLVANQFGTSVITVSATDTAGETIADEFTLTVNNVNQAPVGAPDTYRVPQGTLLSVGADRGVLANDGDPEGGVLRARIIRQPNFASQFSFSQNGSFTYLHNNSGRQTDSFVYRVSDGQLESQDVTVTIIIDAPPPPSHQNPNNRLDVSADGNVSPVDALLVISLLNDPERPRSVSLLPPPPPYYDVDGNGTVGPNDALLVINFLNDRSGGGGEGEATGLFAPLIASRSLDNQAVYMDPAPIYGPLLPKVGSLAEAEAAQWIDLSWIDRRATQTGSDEEPEDLALIELMEEFK
jgi:large repetitive protein